MDKKKYIIRLIISFAIIGIALVADLLSKNLIVDFAKDWNGGKLVVIDGFFSLHYVTNTGAAFSMAAGCDNFYSIIIPITFVVLAGMLVALCWPTAKTNMLFSIGISLMFAGALGNMVDRMWLGYVRDFLDFIIFGWDFAVFNVADAELCVGVGLLIVWILFFYARDEIKKEQTEKETKE